MISDINHLLGAQDEPWPDRDVMVGQLTTLAKAWVRRSANKFRNSDLEEMEFGKRFIQHGAICYWNCANELQELLKSWNPAPDFKPEILKQDSECP